MKKRTPRTVKKHPVLCKNGPMVGETLYLSYDGLNMTPAPILRTAYITYRGETGRYVNGEWQTCAK